MGICSSFGPSTVATAKLILEDGRLEEFRVPVRVSQILQRNPSCFICNADDLDFDDHVSAINDDEKLELGQLYFELPVSWLDTPIKAQEMAALAVKASLAVKMVGGRDGCCWFRLRSVDLVELNTKKPVEDSPLMTIGGRVGSGYSGGLVARRRRGGGGGGRVRKFNNKLSAILEE
ncbi:hypothetical protein P3X46_032737 [Hevea brasiliensis]|uniref:Uncharacterized protein n=1 Tax=Hevea brasiliensis TaxID=3981 RepID=A0ABQ9KEA4_HEVBR|nr:uncharacterized protein LOC110635833 [Hevea brasiliensis]KAJ9135567.1 hypothetical protein P3X46_032737 [Hevea brasiliensis]